jgi:ribose 5-phosphate isomerase A
MGLPSRLARIGQRAASEVTSGMIVGLGTGSTATAFVVALGERVAGGLSITGIATSVETETLARSLSIPLAQLDDIDRINLCVDGADEIDPYLNVTKGRGGALLFEKLVARRADRYVIIASDEKLVDVLGARIPLPVEVVPMGWRHTAQELGRLGLVPELRKESSNLANPFRTDGGHYIVDCASDRIADPGELAGRIKAITGVVDHGLFVGMADLAMTVDADGEVTTHARPAG